MASDVEGGWTALGRRTGSAEDDGASSRFSSVATEESDEWVVLDEEPPRGQDIDVTPSQGEESPPAELFMSAMELEVKEDPEACWQVEVEVLSEPETEGEAASEPEREQESFEDRADSSATPALSEVVPTPPRSCSGPCAELLPFTPSALEVQAAAVVVDAGGFQCNDEPWLAALQDFPDVSGAFYMGRVVVARGGDAAVLNARVRVRNAGLEAWPEATTLRVVAGESHGFGALPIGALPGGHAAELLLDLQISPPATSSVCAGAGTRSGSILVDGAGAPFGPLLTLEVLWF
eukprot:TRINITY_DN3787_c0_g1_i2.p2 TRINITY_DN3787_c0_g1~~TRINITY_DN3787_c0_g1_i2.p2  ORF type:complete len:292 (+),score=71.71 TRINITY_DN3787_c0_g1_i2:87-962(+)